MQLVLHRTRSLDRCTLAAECYDDPGRIGTALVVRLLEIDEMGMPHNTFSGQTAYSYGYYTES